MGVLTTNILWKIPQRQHTAMDIGRCIAAEHVLMRAGWFYSSVCLLKKEVVKLSCKLSWGSTFIVIINY